MLSEKRRWPALQVAFTYMGTVVGAGFASGQEIWQFFGRFGTVGWITALVSGVLFCVIGYAMMRLGVRYQAQSFLDVSRQLLGQTGGRLVNILFMLMLFGITIAMLAGAGELFHERLGIPFQVGAILTVLISFLTIRRGISGLLRANMIIVPIMISFVIITGAHSLFTWNGQTLVESPGHAINTLVPAVIYAIVYSCFNVGLSAGVLIPLGNEMGDMRILQRGALLAGVGLTFMISIVLIVLKVHPDATGYEVPMAYVAVRFGTILQALFLLVLWAEIYSTLVGNVYAMIAVWSHRPDDYRSIATAVILVGAFAFSHIGFSKVVSYGYSAFGYISAGLLVMLLWPRE